MRTWSLGSHLWACERADAIVVGEGGYVVRRGRVLDHAADQLVLDGGCGAPGTTAKEHHICVLDWERPVEHAFPPGVASARRHPWGVVVGRSGIIATNGVRVSVRRPDGSTSDEAVEPQLVRDRVKPLPGFAGCDSEWWVRRPLERESPETRFAFTMEFRFFCDRREWSVDVAVIELLGELRWVVLGLR